MNTRTVLSLSLLLLAAGCNNGDSVRDGPGATRDKPGPAFSAIAADEQLRFTGTEPFWGGEVKDGSLLYSTPENPQGTQIEVNRFAGNNGLSFSGSLGGQAFDMAVTQAPCSDGMSDRTYPFTVSLRLGAEVRQGCGWTARQPFKGAPAP